MRVSPGPVVRPCGRQDPHSQPHWIPPRSATAAPQPRPASLTRGPPTWRSGCGPRGRGRRDAAGSVRFASRCSGAACGLRPAGSRVRVCVCGFVFCFRFFIFFILLLIPFFVFPFRRWRCWRLAAGTDSGSEGVRLGAEESKRSFALRGGSQKGPVPRRTQRGTRGGHRRAGPAAGGVHGVSAVGCGLWDRWRAREAPRGRTVARRVTG